MDTKEYIESGILEAYVLGALPAEGEAHVLAAIERNPELELEIENIENTLFQFAVNNEVTPPPHMEAKIWKKITDGQEINNVKEGLPSSDKESINFSVHPVGWWTANLRYAALWIGLGGSILLNAALFFRSGVQRNELSGVVRQIDSIRAANISLVLTVNNYIKSKKMMADNDMQTIVMHTVVKGHPMAATLYVNKYKTEGYVMIDALPVPPDGMQYQLWAMQAGKPVDMGTIDIDIANTSTMQKIEKSAISGEAFAISLEKKGGSIVPTMENIYVMGKS
ncbi:MAG: anti-sigma factor [Taibaiella sp.]|nr:anti-sigma factor [Taibaiella sp.]